MNGRQTDTSRQQGALFGHVTGHHVIDRHFMAVSGLVSQLSRPAVSVESLKVGAPTAAE